MALEYKSLIGLEAIMPVLDEHVVWYGKLVRSYFEGKPSNEASPMVFSEWLVKAKAEKSISNSTAERVRRIHEGMIHAAHSFTTKYASREAPPLQEYNELTRHYEEFIQAMRQIELDQAVENSGFDEKTGLRSLKLLQPDFDREMERRARRGNPFSLSLVKINNYKDEWRADEKGSAAMIKKISDHIKESLRSFDDAYYLGEEYFVLALKHADALGSQAAMARLNQAITSAHIPAPDDPLEEISISSVISEPTQGDKLPDMLENMKKDLVGIDAKGTVLQYNDLSPLQRYIHSMGKEK
jgi:diguanylate cyclase (GGDEF)-like protein